MSSNAELALTQLIKKFVRNRKKADASSWPLNYIRVEDLTRSARKLRDIGLASIVIKLVKMWERQAQSVVERRGEGMSKLRVLELALVTTAALLQFDVNDPQNVLPPPTIKQLDDLETAIHRLPERLWL
jgi:hypothetical protein